MAGSSPAKRIAFELMKGHSKIIEEMEKQMRKAKSRQADFSFEAIGLDPAIYQAALKFLFDRQVPAGQEQEWYWDIDIQDFVATPLEWTQIQTALFARAGEDLQSYSDEQVGMGLNYVMNNAVSNISFMAINKTVPLPNAMLMMQAMPLLWKHCIDPRLAHSQSRIGTCEHGKLDFVCYMWFDVWPTFWNVKEIPEWQDAMWQVLCSILDVPSRAVRIAGLHGIGHNLKELRREEIISARIDQFILAFGKGDEEIKQYALAAKKGMVQ